MKMSRYILIGILFGITLFKAEAVSWFRIYEMFRFQSFHMYGIIASAIVLGIIVVQLIKRQHMKSIEGVSFCVEALNKPELW